ncbi:hypothetical protein CYMTET_5522 [Cymbomonas tetramitiformis]|uniref:Mutator-like transposase domain-containing protein n=1 Tax=Cymbomonas tetramitiformis TaxID=36881 RepID=A0AAE0GZE9_9CHLO|nr:hypothetical protein CYMTET_5522 [Cymbomonas tetramitiformis]
MLPTTVNGSPKITHSGLACDIHMVCTVCCQHTVLPTSRRSRKNTFEVNTLRALGEQNVGLQPVKVEKFLTTLGVQYKLHHTNHGKLQKRVGREITAMANESCQQALAEEATVTKEKGYVVNDVVQLSATGDCAWPNRGSGRSYASFCGMFVLVGALNKKILSTTIFDKMCYTCELAEKKPPGEDGHRVPPPAHDCWRGARGINCDSQPGWRGTSKAMEASGVVLCVKFIGTSTSETKMRVAKFTSDEDSNMIAAINDPKGIVPAELQHVEKLSDPNHLQKLLYKALVDLRTSKHWSGSPLSKAVIEYFNKLYRYVIKSVAPLDQEMDDKREAAAAARRSYTGKSGRLKVRLEKSSRNVEGAVEGTYAGGLDLANDKYGNSI